MVILRRHGAGERLGGRDAGRAGSDEQEYRAGAPHNILITETAAGSCFSRERVSAG